MPDGRKQRIGMIDPLFKKKKKNKTKQKELPTLETKLRDANEQGGTCGITTGGLGGDSCFTHRQAVAAKIVCEGT